MRVFEELLLDADWSVNAGSWMWLSCSSFFQQFFHCYCPVGFGRRTDPNGDYIRRYLPILRGFPAKYIYDPWNAPETVQKVAKCIIGVHYPKPMVHHAEASRLNIERMKQIYQQLSCYRGLGLLASVPSNSNNDNRTSNNEIANSSSTKTPSDLCYTSEQQRAAAVSSGYQLSNQPQGDWQSGVRMYKPSDTQTIHQQGYSAAGTSMYYSPSSQDIHGHVIHKRSEHHSDSLSGKRSSDEIGNNKAPKVQRH